MKPISGWHVRFATVTKAIRYLLLILIQDNELHYLIRERNYGLSIFAGLMTAYWSSKKHRLVVLQSLHFT